MTWDFYQSTYGRNGIFGDGSGSYNRVHYGSGYVNAFWDGTKMTYGDGDGTSFGPLVSLDVAGHEMSHGVTEHSADLTYEGESGGLNEATSDIFGTMVEFFAANANDPGDYLIGEEFDLANHAGFRRMDNPVADGSSLNCWTSTRATSTSTTRRASATTSSTCWPRARVPRPSTASRTTARPATARPSAASAATTRPADLVPRADGLHDVEHRLRRCSDGKPGRRSTDLFGAGSVQYNAVAAAWSAVGVG